MDMENQQAQNKKQTSIILKAILLYITSFVLGLFLAPIFGDFYDLIFKPKRGLSLLEFDVGNSFDGFILGYVLLLSIITTFVVLKNRSRFLVWLVGVSVILLSTVVGGGFKQLLLLLLLSVVGFIIGLLLRLLFKNLRLINHNRP